MSIPSSSCTWMSIPSSSWGTCGQLACLAHSARRSSSAGQGGGPPGCRSWCAVRWRCWLHSQLSSRHRELHKSPSRRPVPIAAKIFNFTILQPLEVSLEACIRQRMQARLSAHLYEKGHLISATTGRKANFELVLGLFGEDEWTSWAFPLLEPPPHSALVQPLKQRSEGPLLQRFHSKPHSVLGMDSCQDPLNEEGLPPVLLLVALWG